MPSSACHKTRLIHDCGGFLCVWIHISSHPCRQVTEAWYFSDSPHAKIIFVTKFETVVWQCTDFCSSRARAEASLLPFCRGLCVKTGCSSCSEEEQVAVTVTTASEWRRTVAPLPNPRTHGVREFYPGSRAQTRRALLGKLLGNLSLEPEPLSSSCSPARGLQQSWSVLYLGSSQREIWRARTERSGPRGQGANEGHARCGQFGRCV